MPTFILTLLAVLAGAVPVLGQSTVIRGASVIDGTGSPARVTDVRIRGGIIAEVGRVRKASGDRIVDGSGLVLAPGFIDSHSHHDRGLLESRDALAAVSQGITTIVVGQDGGSRFPLSRFLARLDSQPAAVNVASFAGHGTLRRRVMGDDYERQATAAEVARMAALLREEMGAGALGLSTGLEYDPGIHSAPSEVMALGKVAAAHGGRYISHLRSEDRDFWSALDELLAIGREAGLPVQVTHLKLAMRGLWGRGDSVIRVLDRARAAGIDVTADVYPYTMWQSTLTVLYPKRNFGDRAETEFILREVAAPEDLVIGDWALDPSYVGKHVGEIAALRKTDPATTLMALIAESQARQADESVVARGMDERDIAAFLRWPYTSVSSDGALGGAHPRGFGAFPRVLAKYVREEGVLPLPDAIRRMTSLPAASLGIAGRGRIAPGMGADLVLFDPRTVADRATLERPHEPAAGIRTVWVNGEVVYDGGRTTGKHPGHTLRRAASGDTSRTARIDSLVRAEMRRQRIPGVSLGIVHRGAVVTRGYGHADVEHWVPVTDETIFQSGSLGKMFTAAAVMLQVEDGRLSLDDPLTRFFPEAPAAWKSITVRHLLTHTSGIPDYTTEAFDYRKDYREEELARMAFAQPLEFPAGSRWNYSNTGYALLGFIVGKVAGRFYGDELAARVFRPLGMTTARVITEEAIVPNRASGYRLDDGVLKNQEWVAPALNTTADGSLYFSMRDLVAWEKAVRARAVLKPSSWELILSPAVLTSGKTYPYGFGWGIDERGGAPLHEHGGAWQGFKSQLSRFVGEDLTIMVLANLADADPGEIVDGVAAIVNPSLAAPVPAPIADREPKVTARLKSLLASARAGTLTPADFAYVRAGFFPGAANRYREMLRKLPAPSRFVLLERKERGDDRVYLYEVAFGDQIHRVRLGLAPDDRISGFAIWRK